MSCPVTRPELPADPGDIPVPVALPAEDSAETGALPVAAIDSRTLFQGQKVLHIQHDGAVYQLRTTKTGKLILTK